MVFNENELENEDTLSNGFKNYLFQIEEIAKQIGVWDEAQEARNKALEELSHEDMSELDNEEISNKFLAAEYGSILKVINSRPKYKITNLANTLRFKKALKLIKEAALDDYNKDMNDGKLCVNERNFDLIDGTSNSIEIIAPNGVDFANNELKKFIEACSLADCVSVDNDCNGNIYVELDFSNTENTYFETKNTPPEKRKQKLKKL